MRLRIGLKASLTALAAAAFLAVGAGQVAAQGTGTIQGLVTDASNQEPVEAAQVFIPGTQFGTLTDSRGRYLLVNVPAGQHTVRAEVIGYNAVTKTVTVTAGAAATADFSLTSTALKINQIVVTGVVGATPKTQVPFVVDKVDASQLPVPAINAAASIQGQVAGAQVVQGSGAPGSAADILLRGATSIDAAGRDQSPLFIVDGVIVDPSVSNPLADINAQDIKSIEVVKGAAAASLYGSRAANGVIQITTKRGASLAENTSQYTFRSEYGRSSLPREISLAQENPYLMNASKTKFISTTGNEITYADTTQQLQLDGSSTYTSFQVNPFPGTHYNQVKRFFAGGTYADNYLSVEGRRGNTNYYLSYDNTHNGGVVRFTDGSKRQNFRVNIDHGLTQDLQISVSSFYSDTRTDNSNGDFFSLTFAAPTWDLLQHLPTSSTNPLTLTTVADPRNGEEQNPIYSAVNEYNVTNTSRFMGSTNIKYSPTGYFDLQGNVSYDRTQNNQTVYYPKGYQTRQPGTLTEGQVHKYDNYNDALNGSVTAGFHKAFGKLIMRNQLRYLFESDNTNAFDAFGENLAVADVPTLSVAQGTKTVGSSQTAIRSEGYFFITNLTLNDRYVLSGLVRRDGSSLFGSQQRWQTYFRVSGAWRMAQESWWPFKTALPQFKLRASYGTAGGRPDFYAQYETYQIQNTTIVPVTLGNTQLKPEHDAELSAGVDALIANRVTASVTYAKDVVGDQILNVPLQGYEGFTTQWRNAGTLESKTWEGSLDAQLYQGKGINWSANFNISHTKSVITQFNLPPFQFGYGNAFYARKGEVYGTFYGDKWATSCSDLAQGVSCSDFQKNDKGYLVYVGQGHTYKDGIADNLWGTTSGSLINPVTNTPYDWGMPIKSVDKNGNTFLPMGNTTPNYVANLGSTVTWKGLSLYGLFSSSQGFDIYNETRQWNIRENRAGEEDQGGKPQGLQKPLAYYTTLYDVNNINSHFVENGSYVKLRELSVRYSFDKSQLQALKLGGLSRLTLSLIGRNLYTWTNYTGYDPEVGQSGGVAGSAVIGRFDAYSYPNFRTVTAAVEVVF